MKDGLLMVAFGFHLQRNGKMDLSPLISSFFLCGTLSDLFASVVRKCSQMERDEFQPQRNAEERKNGLLALGFGSLPPRPSLRPLRLGGSFLFRSRKRGCRHSPTTPLRWEKLIPPHNRSRNAAATAQEAGTE